MKNDKVFCDNCVFFPSGIKKFYNADNIYCNSIRVIGKKYDNYNVSESLRNQFTFEDRMLCSERNKDNNCNRHRKKTNITNIVLFSIFFIIILIINIFI